MLGSSHPPGCAAIYRRCPATREPRLKRRRANETGMVAVVPVVAASLRFVLPSEVSVIRRLGDKSLAWLASLAPWTGAPGSHQRTWEKSRGRSPTKAFISNQGSVTPRVKAFEKTIFNPGTLVRTWGTRPEGKAWWEAGKAVGERTANRRTELRSFLF